MLRYTFSNNGSGRPYSRENLVSFRSKDNACVVLDDCRVVFASETERFTKVKHDFSEPIWPFNAFQESFKEKRSQEKLEHLHAEVVERNHHENHIFEAFYQSGFKESAVLVNDGFGNLSDSVTLAYMVEGQDPVILRKFSADTSLCMVYANASSELFAEDNSEGKFMGLAAYGQNNSREYIRWDDSRQDVVADKKGVITDINRTFDFVKSKDRDVMQARDIAYTVQKNFEDTIVEIVKYFKSLLEQRGLHTDNLCMSGGGILNCPTNSRIVDLGLFEHYYASPQPCDGCAESVGKLLRNMHFSGEKLTSSRLETSYLGRTYERDDATSPCEWIDDYKRALVNDLKQGTVIAWYQGGAEYGPRALGHRSFLADPSKKEMLDALNRIKARAWWRPLAPIVPEELFTRVFEVENTDMCEFMLRTLKIKERWQPRLQAVCHTDGTTRPQLLKRDVNPQLYDLLMMYFEETHIPCLVNTSLNINGFPIVETPRDLCNLGEEVYYMEDIPKVKTVFIEDNGAFEVIPPAEGIDE